MDPSWPDRDPQQHSSHPYHHPLRPPSCFTLPTRPPSSLTLPTPHSSTSCVSQHPYPWHFDGVGVAQTVFVSTFVFVIGTLVSLVIVSSLVLVAVMVSVFAMVMGL